MRVGVRSISVHIIGEYNPVAADWQLLEWADVRDRCLHGRCRSCRNIQCPTQSDIFLFDMFGSISYLAVWNNQSLGSPLFLNGDRELSGLLKIGFGGQNEADDCPIASLPDQGPAGPGCYLGGACRLLDRTWDVLRLQCRFGSKQRADAGHRLENHFKSEFHFFRVRKFDILQTR